MKSNRPMAQAPVMTHEGAPAQRITPLQELRRSVMACLLGEDSFYEDGKSLKDRIAALVPKVKAEDVAAIAIEARESMKLRHAPLWVVKSMSDAGGAHRRLVKDTLASGIQRADELAEYVSLAFAPKRPLAAGEKKGLAAAFRKFSEYDLQKYYWDGAVKLRDVLFLCHAKPKDDAQADLWKRLVNGTLATADTWEVAISACKTPEDKLREWTRLLEGGKLGAMAFLRNLRNLREAKVDAPLIRGYFETVKVDRVLPYRFIAAAKHAPEWEPELEKTMFRCAESLPKLTDRTVILVDASGSMNAAMSGPAYRGRRTGEASPMTRLDAACALAMIAREVCTDVRVYAFSSLCKRIPARRGFGLRDAIVGSMPHDSTYLGKAMQTIAADGPFDRIVVITDEQSHDGVPTLIGGKGYLVNVASYQNGVGYHGEWTHLDGFSENLLTYIRESEAD